MKENTGQIQITCRQITSENIEEKKHMVNNVRKHAIKLPNVRKLLGGE